MYHCDTHGVLLCITGKGRVREANFQLGVKEEKERLFPQGGGRKGDDVRCSRTALGVVIHVNYDEIHKCNIWGNGRITI